MTNSDPRTLINDLSAANQPIALRLVPIMCAWWGDELPNILTGIQRTNYMGKEITLPVYRLEKDKSFTKRPPSSMNNWLDTPTSMNPDKLKALETIPNNLFVKKLELKMAYSAYRSNLVAMTINPGSIKESAIDWEPSLGQFKKVIEECPDDLLNILPKTNNPKTSQTGADGDINQFSLTGDYWTITFNNKVTNIKNTAGLRYIDRLIQLQGKEITVDNLYYTINPPDSETVDSTTPTSGNNSYEKQGLTVSNDLGDAGEALTPKVTANLKEAIESLDEEIKEAINNKDKEKQQDLEEKKGKIITYLNSNTGLGHRPRKVSNTIERIRSNVTQCIRRAKEKLSDTLPELQAHLDANLKTGLSCSYSPNPAIKWKINSN